MIENVKIYPVFNLWGKRTLEIKVFTENGIYSASVPAGTSRGENEAKEVSVPRALKIFPEIRKNLIGLDEKEWEKLDRLLIKLDGTQDFRDIGVNTALAASVAVARAAMNNELWRLDGRKLHADFPFPVSNVIGGGKHGGGCDWQEFLIIPHRAKNPFQAARTIIDFWTSIGEELKKKKLLAGRNLENAWMGRLDNLRTLDFLSRFASDWDVRIGVDFAASSLWNGKKYVYKGMGKKLGPEKQIDFIKEVAEKYRIYYLEDPFHENDFKSFSVLTKELQDSLVTGDDLYCTNPKRLALGTRSRAGSGVIIKPNQIGTLYQTKQVIDIARRKGMFLIPSHRSEETGDNWLADLAINWEAPLIKIGLSDIPKFNRLIELWDDIANSRMAELP